MEDESILRGKSVAGKVSTAIYMASRKLGQPRDIKQILAVTHATQKDLSSCYKIAKMHFPELKVSIESWQVADQACNKLNLPMDVNSAARSAAKAINELEIATGRQPQTLAGVAVFMVSQLSTDKKTIGEIADAVMMTEQTIKQGYKDVYDFRHLIIPQWWKSKEPLEYLIKP